jgi:hydroxymethylglutaryl-CoA lyase
MTDLGAHVDIRDVSLRDGLQIEEPIPLSAKLELLAAVAATGVREMEATAFVSPSKVPALADAAELAAELHNFTGIEFSALVASTNGAKRAIAAGLGSIEYVVSAADGHSRANVGRSTAEATAQIPEIVAIAHDSGASVEVIIATAWDCPFDGPTPPQRVVEVVTAARDAGADRLAIADTIGTTTPRRVTDLVATIRPLVGDTPLGAHFHNTRGAGLASAYAAVASGVTRLDASAGGLGGCPFAPGATGNIATEDLVYMLRDSGIHVDVDLQAAIAAADVAQRVVGHDLPSSLLRAGDRIRD